MDFETLNRHQFRQARDRYVITKSSLPSSFTWADKVSIPGRETLSDCGRSVAKLGMKVQGIKYPDPKDFRKIVNTGGTGIDPLDLEKGMKRLGVEVESFFGVHAAMIIESFSHSPDVWVFSHQMLAGHYTQYRDMKNGHYAVVVYANKKQLITADPGLCIPRWGRMSPFVYDRIRFDNKIDDPSEIIHGWAMRIGVAKSVVFCE